MELSCSSWSLRGEIPDRMSLLEFPAWCGARGIPTIEIAEMHLPSRTAEYLTELRRACTRAAVRISCLAVENDFTLPDGARRADEIEHVRRTLYELASPLGVPVVRVCMGMADTTPAGDERALEAFRGLRVDMERTEVTLALENHARVQTPPEKLAAIIAGVNTPLFGCCLDFGIEPVDRRFLAINELAPLTRHVHARSWSFNSQGEERDIDYKRAIAVLHEYAYDGVISILYDGAGDPYQGVLATKALIEKHWYNPAAGYGQMAA